MRENIMPVIDRGVFHNYVYMCRVTIDTEEQVSISHRSDITTGSGTNSHRSDIATKNSFFAEEHKA